MVLKLPRSKPSDSQFHSFTWWGGGGAIGYVLVTPISESRILLTSRQQVLVTPSSSLRPEALIFCKPAQEKVRASGIDAGTGCQGRREKWGPDGVYRRIIYARVMDNSSPNREPDQRASEEKLKVRVAGHSPAAVKIGPSIKALPVSSRYATSLRETPRSIAGSQSEVRCEKPT